MTRRAYRLLILQKQCVAQHELAIPIAQAFMLEFGILVRDDSLLIHCIYQKTLVKILQLTGYSVICSSLHRTILIN